MGDHITKNPVPVAGARRNAAFFPSARTAWRAVIDRTGAQRLLLPAYIGITDREGSGVLDPVTESGAEVSFYEVDGKLRANLDDLRKKLATGSFDLLLVIHYFGLLRCDLPAVRQLCDAHGVVLVEDCAHAFHWSLSEPVLGRVGDFAFYSIHKHLSTSGGGILTAKETDVRDWGTSIDPQILTTLALSDGPAITAARRANATYLTEALAGVDGLSLISDTVATLPQTLGIRIEDGLREKLYFALIERGFPTVALYYRMHPLIDAEKYPVSHEVAGSILNLPVHQATSLEALEALVAALKACLSELRA